MRALHGVLVATLLAVLVACGVSAPPLPPSLHLPQPVSDLKASRKGDTVTLTWTVPHQSTDHEPLRGHLGVSRVCREVGGNKSASCSQPVAHLAPSELPAAQHDESGRKLPVQVAITDTLAKEMQQQNPAGMMSYAVETLNTNGRSAGLSNRVQVPLVPVPAPPNDIFAQITSDAVQLRFSPVPLTADERAFIGTYRVSRSLKDANNFTPLGFAQSKNGGMMFEDRSFEWEAPYLYKITPMATAAGGSEIEGQDSRTLEVFTHDVFPPATPVGLQAVSSGTATEKFIDLTWAPNTESDLAGYNLYRRQPSGDLVRINKELITTPAFRDSTVLPSRRYVYAVSAVDIRRNESEKSEEASEFVP